MKNFPIALIGRKRYIMAQNPPVVLLFKAFPIRKFAFTGTNEEWLTYIQSYEQVNMYITFWNGNKSARVRKILLTDAQFSKRLNKNTEIF